MSALLFSPCTSACSCNLDSVPKTPKNPRALRTIVSDSESDTEPVDEEPDPDSSRMGMGKAGDDGVLQYDPSPFRRPIPRPVVASPVPANPFFHSALDVRSTPGGGEEVITDPSPFDVAGPSKSSKKPPTSKANLLDFFTLSRQKSTTTQNVTNETSTNITESSSLTSTSQRPKVTTAGTPRAKSPTKRKTKKQLEQEKHEQLSSYAQELFNELNASVFQNGLPAATAIVWNKRLAQTAGRAKWHM